MLRIHPLRACLMAALSATALMSASPSGWSAVGGMHTVPSDIPTITQSATLTGRLSTSALIPIDIVLPVSNPQQLSQFAAQVSDPKSVVFGQFLTPDEFAARFGAPKADYDAVRSWAKSHGFTESQTSIGRTLLALHGTQSQVEAAFNVHLNTYKDSKGNSFFAADAAPSVPSEIASRVSSVLGLSNYAIMKAQFKVLTDQMRRNAEAQRSLGAQVATPASGHGHGGGFDATDLIRAYGLSTTYTGTNQTLGVYEDTGYFPNDIAKYETFNHLPATKVTPRLVNGFGGTVNGDEVEAVLDIDMELTSAPDARNILVYEDGENFDASLLNCLTAMADDNKAKTISISYGLDEAIQGTTQIAAEGTVLEQLVAQGQDVFASAGDGGAYGDEPPTLNVGDPGSQPWLVCVGGTTLFTGAGGGYEGEITWNNLGLTGGATGGGISSYWPIPPYQLYPDGSSFASYNGGSATNRNVPDVAAVADPITGVSIYSALYGGWIVIGGTSISSPLWAGFASQLNEFRADLGVGSLGFLDPTLYNDADEEISIGYFYDFDDIYDGSNGNVNLYGVPGFNAGINYDNATGLGSMYGTNMLVDLGVYPTNPDVSPPDAPSVTATATSNSITLHWNKAAGATGYLIIAEGSNGLFYYTATKDRTFTQTGLKSSTVYPYYVYAVNTGGINTQGEFVVETLP